MRYDRSIGYAANDRWCAPRHAVFRGRNDYYKVERPGDDEHVLIWIGRVPPDRDKLPVVIVGDEVTIKIMAVRESYTWVRRADIHADHRFTHLRDRSILRIDAERR